MTQQSSFDELTATYTRNSFICLVNKFFSVQKLQGMIVIDIDDLKFINMNKSKAIGDIIITMIVRNIYNSVPKNAIVGRIGSDSFAIFFQELQNPWVLADIAQELVLIHRQPIVYRTQSYIRTISAGGVQTSWLDKSGLDGESLLHFAEISMEMAKHNGKNQYIELSKAHLQELNRKSQVLNLLKETLNQKSFHLNFQPFFNLQSGELIGFEALCRLNEADGTNVSPDEFIKIAEENNFIYDIDMFVLEYICKLMEQYADHSFQKIISFNVSPLTFMNPAFISNLREIIKKYHVYFGYLAIELTETAFIESFSRAKEVISELNTLGIKILLDDFGVGYSNLQSVMELNVDILKIDRSLIGNIHEAKSNIIVKKTVEIAELLKMDVVAEGIETRMQFEMLKNMNIKAGQGFYLGRPLTVAQMIPYMAARP